jgi:DNA-directed RNA polymerase specialized sigma24 family protein
VTRAGPGRPRKDWSLSGEALDALLRHLDPDPEHAGERYEVLRRKLVHMFRWRGCTTPEDLADLTLDRVAAKLAEGVDLRTDLPGYVHGIARNALREFWRRPAAPAPPPAAPGPEPDERQDFRLDCLERCLGRLSEDARELVTRYHEAPPGRQIAARQDLARRLGVTATALRLRAYRIRASLQACITECETERPPETEPGLSA